MMKISEWLESIEYDSLHDSAGLKADFQARTGVLAVEREHHLAIVITTPDVPPDTVITAGIDVARAIEQIFIPGRRAAAEHYSGRGRNFSAIVQTLREVGL